MVVQQQVGGEVGGAVERVRPVQVEPTKGAVAPPPSARPATLDVQLGVLFLCPRR